RRLLSPVATALRAVLQFFSLVPATGRWLQAIRRDRCKRSLPDKRSPLLIQPIRRERDSHERKSTFASSSHCFAKRDRKILPPISVLLRGTTWRPLPAFALARRSMGLV